MSFASGIANYAKRTNLSIDNAVIAICAEASTSIIEMTPVDTGRAKGNWFATIGTPSNDVSDTRSDGVAMADAISTAKGASGKVFFLTNNLSYIRPLEYGHSKQATVGMVRITVAKIENELGAFK